MSLPMHPDAARLLVESGLLFQINRDVLHPIGLALVVNEDDDGKHSIAGVWDASSDPEGILFSEESYADGAAKLEAFMRAVGNARIETRRKALGYVVQSAAPGSVDAGPSDAG